MTDPDVTDYSGELSRMERRIRTTEARASAETELNNDMSGDVDGAFDDNERNSKVDNDLAALKARMGMGGTGATETGGSETRNLGKKQGQ